MAGFCMMAFSAFNEFKPDVTHYRDHQIYDMTNTDKTFPYFVIRKHYF